MASVGLPAAGSVLKNITKYLQQAKKLEKLDPLVCYYCRLYALQVGIKIQNKSPDDLKLIGQIMTWMEQNQSVVQGLSKEDARAHVENFALQVFSQADNEDRNGHITKQTAASFMAAYTFMDVTRQFGELASDIEQKIKYALWKAADITKAFKEGRVPKPGGFDEQMEDVGVPLAADSHPEEMKSATAQHVDSFSTSSLSSHHFQPTPTAPSLPYVPMSSAPAAAAGDIPYQSNQLPLYPPPAQNDMFHPSPSVPPPSSIPSNPQPSASASAPPATSPTNSSNIFSQRLAQREQSSTNGIGSTGGVAHASHAASSHSSHNPNAANARATLLGNGRSAQLREAERFIKHSLGAIAFDDVDTTVIKLRQALDLLAPHVKNTALLR